ncbi:MAG: hypothetical protein QOE04_4797 [Mycobacterium sp.]|nr:hypothetical protein [Mycobacterium sp.]
MTNRAAAEAISAIAARSWSFGSRLADSTTTTSIAAIARCSASPDPGHREPGVEVGAGDSKQALGVMLTCSKQGLPKIAMVSDEDVDIWDDNAVQFAMAFRYMPHLDTVTTATR